MTENYNQNEYRENAKTDHGESLDFKINKSAELEDATKVIAEIGNAIAHNEPVSSELFLDLQKSLANILIDIGNEQIPLRVFGTSEALKNNIEWNKEIEKGETGYARSVSFLTKKAAEGLVESGAKSVHLDKLKILPPHIAAILSKFGQYYANPETAEIDFGGLKGDDVADESWQNLSETKAALYLFGLERLSMSAASILAKHNGYLALQGLNELPDDAAEALSGHKGGLSLFTFSKPPSDSAIESLSRTTGELNLDSLAELSDTAAEALSRHSGGKLGLDDLETISDNALQLLRNHQGPVSLPAKIEQRFNKLKET